MFGGDSQHEAVCVVEDACGNGDEFSAQAFAVRTSVRSGVETAKGVEPGGDVQREQRRLYPGAVHRYKTGGEVAKSCSELRVFDLFLDKACMRNHASISITSQSRLVQMKL